MNVYIVYFNERSGSVAMVFKDKDKAKQYIKDGNGLYMEMIDTFVINE